MDSSSQSPISSRSRSFGMEEESRWCHCGMRSFLQVARTESNYGRRFFSCPNYKGDKKCKFFVWKDQQFGDQAQDVIRELCLERERLRNLVEVMKKKEICKVAFDAEADNWSNIEAETGLENKSLGLKESKLKELKKKVKIREEKLQKLEEKLREEEEKLRHREEIIKKREDKCAKSFVIGLLVVVFFMVLVLNV